jgi:hypothetical protein
MKKFAVFCPVKNETTFSSTWFKYYSQYLPVEDIYFLDFGSDNISNICQVVKSDKDICDADELFQEIKRFHKELLTKYEYVIPTDVDEILYHKDGLDNYINNFKGNFVRSKGYELVHLPEIEPDFDMTQTIFSQRNYWFRSPYHYDKTLITNKSLNWTIGLHYCHDFDLVDDDLLLIHLHRFDYKTCVERHLKWSNLQWSKDTVDNNYNWHYRQPDVNIISNWYFTLEGNISEIPSEIKDNILI